MTPVVSVHIADVGRGAALRLLSKRTALAGVPGLRNANIGAATPLSTSLLPSPSFRRVGLIAFWDDDAAIESFLRSDSRAARFADGWSARLEPLRMFGSWPGLPDDINRSRHTDYDGPALVLTFGRLRLTQTVRFLRASAKAAGAAIAAPGAVWATALARPPFVATCSIWESARALSSYAYGTNDRGHPDAMESDSAKPFHRRSAFVRLRPYRVEGSLGGANPLAAGALAAVTS
ncbi:MAG: hypothetical protein QOI95_4326 [Acidimicrobiaceae bacterium]